MKTYLDRIVPIPLDISEQFALYPEAEYVLFVLDGKVPRAFAVDSVNVNKIEGWVRGINKDGYTVTMAPFEAKWLVLRRDMLSLVSNRVLEQNELTDTVDRQKAASEAYKTIKAFTKDTVGPTDANGVEILDFAAEKPVEKKKISTGLYL